MSEITPASLSRRSLLIAGLAGASVSAVPGLAGASPAAARTPSSVAGRALPSVTPLWSQRAYEAFGVCSHPNFGRSTYQHTSQWMAALADVGASYFRGMYAPGLEATTTTTAQARAHGIRWGMTVAPDLAMSDQEVVSRVRHVAANAADVCLYLEGVNEPNYVRGGGAPPADWVQRTVARQRLIWDAVRADPRLDHVQVVGPSLQAIEATESEYQVLGAGGLARYMDFAGMHRYSGGRYPDHLIDERLDWVDRHWGGRPTWITEAGYTNALATSAGHLPVPEDVSAVYGPSALLEAVDRGCRVAWFELLDDPDPGTKDDIESNFGMFATMTGIAPPWRPKPIVGVMRSFLSSLEDPGATYAPPPIGLRVTSGADDVRSTVVAQRNGDVTVFLRRATNCWDPHAQRRVDVQQVPVVVESARGSWTVSVDHEVRAVAL